MGNRGPFQTPFEEAVAPTPSGEPSGTGNKTGGFDVGAGSKSETPNSLSGLPLQVTTFDVGPGSNEAQAPTPPVASPGTFPTTKPGS